MVGALSAIADDDDVDSGDDIGGADDQGGALSAAPMQMAPGYSPLAVSASGDQNAQQKLAAINRGMSALSNASPQLAAAAGLLAPTRTGSFGESIGNMAQSMMELPKQQLAVEQARQAEIQNQMLGMQLENYRRMYQAMAGARPQMAPGGGALSSGIPPVGAPGPTGGPATVAAAMGAPQGGGMAPQQGGAGGYPVPPMFDVGSLYEQYRIASMTPGMGQMAGQILQMINKGTPPGYYLGQDGGLYMRPGYAQGEFEKAAAEAGGKAQYPIPRYAPGGVDPSGNPLSFNTRTGQYETPGAQQSPQGTQPTGGIGLNDWAARMPGYEDAGGQRDARNPMPGQTATGVDQFTQRTWLNTIKAARPELARSMNDQQLLELRADPALSQEMTAISGRQNGQQLANYGLPVNATTLALAHHFGPDGARAVLNAAPGTPMSSLFPADVLAANPDLAGQTAGSYTQRLAGQVGTEPVDIGLTAHPDQSQPPPAAVPPRPMSPEERELQTKVLPEQFEKAKDQYESGLSLQLQMRQMQDQLGQLGTQGFLAPGTGDTARVNFAKHINTIAKNYLGLADNQLPFDPNKVASSEDILKTTTRLGFDLARQLGSREAMMIVQQAIGAVPGIENTPRGARLIFGSLNAAAQRQIDYYQFLQKWVAPDANGQPTHANTMGADVAFNSLHPPAEYARNALLSGVPQNRIAYLRAHPNSAKDFDAYYGQGLSSSILKSR